MNPKGEGSGILESRIREGSGEQSDQSDGDQSFGERAKIIKVKASPRGKHDFNNRGRRLFSELTEY